MFSRNLGRLATKKLLPINRNFLYVHRAFYIYMIMYNIAAYSQIIHLCRLQILLEQFLALLRSIDKFFKTFTVCLRAYRMNCQEAITENGLRTWVVYKALVSVFIKFTNSYDTSFLRRDRFVSFLVISKKYRPYIDISNIYLFLLLIVLIFSLVLLDFRTGNSLDLAKNYCFFS
jgi:hypothetical protein